MVNSSGDQITNFEVVILMYDITKPKRLKYLKKIAMEILKNKSIRLVVLAGYKPIFPDIDLHH
jgi:hypothetical protein